MNVDKSEQRIRQMFGEISGRYDFLNHFLSMGVDYSWRRATIKSVPTGIEGPILDVCTGTGDLAIAFWKKYRGRVQVVGSDFTHQMLTIANEKRNARRIPEMNGDQQSLTFVEADTQHLPFADDQFSAVSVAFGLRNVTDTRRGIDEMIRVCKPGGQVLILEFGMPTNRLFGALYRWYFKHILPRIGQLLARNKQSAYNYLPASVSEFPHGGALVEMLQEQGLQNVLWKPLTFGVAGLYVGEKLNHKSPPTEQESTRSEPLAAKASHS
ncbi:MAG: bifunctional demethylmenaquinone methyltransferase/2-methoxy-6-polyprenyl-1,4-benzoquinol methylase UbiE [Planctomycetaceae bacterium]|nr:bifunctional demethylmenaquinone methyltransferase/2-methoxy-6-polyprenyl-1,4-benzoquinol methylase UbiE [Planctomycetaceae bacterium]